MVDTVKTTDGFPIKITTSIFSHTEAQEVLQYGPEGVGLFSTDYLFQNRNDLPSEEEQYEIYKQVSTTLGQKPVVIRILNFPPHYLPVPKVENLALGFRGIRLGLCHPEVLKVQFRAILRANTAGNLSILLPGAAHFSELLQVRHLLSEIREDLGSKNIPYRAAEVGIVTEMPAAVFNAEKIGNEASFFCISPDLIKFASAVDPGCEELAYLYDPFEPVFLRMVQTLTETGKKHRKNISLYGPLTAETCAIPILLALDLTELIVDASQIPKVRAIIRSTSMMEAKKIAAKALTFNTADMVKQYAEKSLAKLHR